jgi:hypothetical protein
MNSSLTSDGTIDDMLDAIKLLLNSQCEKRIHTLSELVEKSLAVESPWSDVNSIDTTYCWDHQFRSNHTKLTECQAADIPPRLQFDSPNVHGGSAPIWEQQAPHNTMTLPDVFKLLEPEDEDCIICVKKIHKLGFKSVRVLRQYFSQFGAVQRIIVLPSRQKEMGSNGMTPYSVRPASMCFIVMSTKASCRRILLQELHYVGGEWPVEVAGFNRGTSSNSPHESYVSSSTRASVSY